MKKFIIFLLMVGIVQAQDWETVRINKVTGQILPTEFNAEFTNWDIDDNGVIDDLEDLLNAILDDSDGPWYNWGFNVDGGGFDLNDVGNLDVDVDAAIGGDLTVGDDITAVDEVIGDIGRFRELWIDGIQWVLSPAGEIPTSNGKVTCNIRYDPSQIWGVTPGTLYIFAYADKWMFNAPIGYKEVAITGTIGNGLVNDVVTDVDITSGMLGNTYWFAFFDPNSGTHYDTRFNFMDIGVGGDQENNEPGGYAESMPLQLSTLNDTATLDFYLVDTRHYVPRGGWRNLADYTHDVPVSMDIADNSAGSTRVHLLVDTINSSYRNWWADWDYMFGSESPGPVVSWTVGPSGTSSVEYNLQISELGSLITIVDEGDINNTATWNLGGTLTCEYPAAAETIALNLADPRILFRYSESSNHKWSGFQIEVREDISLTTVYKFQGPSEGFHFEDGESRHLMSPHRTSTTLFDSNAISTEPPASVTAMDFEWRCRGFRGQLDDVSAWTSWEDFTVVSE